MEAAATQPEPKPKPEVVRQGLLPELSDDSTGRMRSLEEKLDVLTREIQAQGQPPRETGRQGTRSSRRRQRAASRESYAPEDDSRQDREPHQRSHRTEDTGRGRDRASQRRPGFERGDPSQDVSNPTSDHGRSGRATQDKPPDRECSSSSDSGSGSGSEDDYHRTNRHRHGHGHRRARSPYMPKMVTFNGSGNWESFIYQFERISQRCEWRPSRKRERLLDCLADQALDYIQKRGTYGGYEDLKEALAQRFMNKDTASLARKQLHSVRQREDETLEEFSQRVHFLAMDGHPNAGESTQQQIAVEAFLIGCKDKRAAEVVMEREPRTIYEAQVMVKTNINNHRALFGSRGLAQRQVAFADHQEDYGLDVRTAHTVTPAAETPARSDPSMSRLQEDLREMKLAMKQVQEAVGALTTLVKPLPGRPVWSSPQRGTPPPSPGRRSPGSPRAGLECHYCHETGHFKNECPKLRARQAAAAAATETPSSNS